MIYLLCSIMVTMPDGMRHSVDLHGYGQKFGSGYIVNLSRDAEFNNIPNASKLTSYQDDFGDECHEDQ